MTADERLRAIEWHKRISAIEARAQNLGWNVPRFKGLVSELIYLDTGMELPGNIRWCPAAERLLALYEPGEVVEIKADAKYEQSCEACELCYCTHDIYYHCILNVEDDTGNPGPDCPGAGRYKLVRCDDDETDSNT